MPDLLEFEEPIGVLMKEIEALSMLPHARARAVDRACASGRRKSARSCAPHLTPWQRVLVARHRLGLTRSTTWSGCSRGDELHGDRRFADDPAIVCGLAEYKGQPVVVIGHQKGRDTKQKILRNFGYARPEGYRKALRVMKLAEKFERPIVVFVDTPAAYPGVESEERGVAEAIALNLREMMLLDVPIVVIVTGEGGSGGALGTYWRPGPDAGILHLRRHLPRRVRRHPLVRRHQGRPGGRGAEDYSDTDLLDLGLIDAIVPEPTGGAHNDYDAATALVDQALGQALGSLASMTTDERLDARYAKFRQMGMEGVAFVDADTSPKNR
jgi:acetyl-CoA carboxylase carboxyl transferase subunit alpha